jgi:hypothetical protein
MLSDIYKACEEGDVNLVRSIIETSPLTVDINGVEPNGSTALHLACEKGYVHIVQLLLHEYDIRRDHKNRLGRTAYEISSDAICTLFHRPIDEANPFCTGMTFQNPFQLINKGNPNWLKFYSNSSNILINDLGNYTVGGFEVPRNGYLYNLKRFIGLDPDKKKIEEWSTHLQCFLDEHLSIYPRLYSDASKCLQDYSESREIEHLLRLYTLSGSICQCLAEDKIKCDYFYAAIHFNLPSMHKRSYKGQCYRGLSMTENDFRYYRSALENKDSYLGMNTFSSTSIKRHVAEDFMNSSSNQLKVLLRINFARICETAIALYKLGPEFPCISKYEDEEEVLILPGTVFSVTKIEENFHSRSKIIYLEHYDTSDVESSGSKKYPEPEPEPPVRFRIRFVKTKKKRFSVRFQK